MDCRIGESRYPMLGRHWAWTIHITHGLSTSPNSNHTFPFFISLVIHTTTNVHQISATSIVCCLHIAQSTSPLTEYIDHGLCKFISYRRAWIACITFDL